MSDIAAVEAAARRIEGRLRRTPLLSSPFLDRIAGRRLLVKAECLQETGSFKARGAWAALSALEPGTGGVIACSSGNHGQGVAWAARVLGRPAVVVMPSDAPALKVANTRALGAEVVLYDRATQDRDALTADLAAGRGLTLVHPFEDPQVIAGQGTVGLEIAADLGTATGEVLVPCGGGGLSAGIALALEARGPGLRVRTVEPAGFDDTARSLAAGERLRNPSASGSICDAILTPSPGGRTFPILAPRAGPGLAVSDDQALDAMALAFLRLKIVLEPGGAVALAAALFQPERLQGDTVVCVASGGNVDPPVFARALARLDRLSEGTP